MHFHHDESFTPEDIQLIHQPTNLIHDDISARVKGIAMNWLDDKDYLSPTVKIEEGIGARANLDFFIVSMESYKEVRGRLEILAAGDPKRDELCKQILEILRLNK